MTISFSHRQSIKQVFSGILDNYVIEIVVDEVVGADIVGLNVKEKRPGYPRARNI